MRPPLATSMHKDKQPQQKQQNCKRNDGCDEEAWCAGLGWRTHGWRARAEVARKRDPSYRESQPVAEKGFAVYIRRTHRAKKGPSADAEGPFFEIGNQFSR